MLTKAKFKKPKPPPVPCEVCRTPVQGGVRCVGCRLRKCRGTLIEGQTCGILGCGIDHPRVLRWHRFSDATIALCANHDALAGRAPTTWVAFRDQAAAADLAGWALSA
jgi:hypothetical protein